MFAGYARSPVQQRRKSPVFTALAGRLFFKLPAVSSMFSPISSRKPGRFSMGPAEHERRTPHRSKAPAEYGRAACVCEPERQRARVPPGAQPRTAHRYRGVSRAGALDRSTRGGRPREWSREQSCGARCRTRRPKRAHGTDRSAGTTASDRADGRTPRCRRRPHRKCRVCEPGHALRRRSRLDRARRRPRRTLREASARAMVEVRRAMKGC